MMFYSSYGQLVELTLSLDFQCRHGSIASMGGPGRNGAVTHWNPDIVRPFKPSKCGRGRRYLFASE